LEEYDQREDETVKQWAQRLIGDDWVELRPPKKDIVFYGQSGAKKQIAPFINRDKAFPNTLILGRPGIGKTLMARWIAMQREESFEEFLCPVNPDDLPMRGIIMLDEAHKQRHPEWLWTVMEDEETSVLAATTRPEQLEPAFKSRFMLTIHLKKYAHESMIEMAQSILSMSEESADLYASASAGNPRQLELILAVAVELGSENHESVLSSCRITGDGLTEYHVSVLTALSSAGRPIGLSSLAGVLYSDEQTVKDSEPLLVEMGLVNLRSNGRAISRNGEKYLLGLEQID
jgi:Holliday junction resolvasome RuvABC ATP-dependent DNA helicase subunit